MEQEPVGDIDALRSMGKQKLYAKSYEDTSGPEWDHSADEPILKSVIKLHWVMFQYLVVDTIKEAFSRHEPPPELPRSDF